MQLCLHGIAEYHHTVHKVAFLVSVFFFFFLYLRKVCLGDKKCPWCCHQTHGRSHVKEFSTSRECHAPAVTFAFFVRSCTDSASGCF